jgi:hypothetical protein
MKCAMCGVEIWWVGTTGWKRIAIDAASSPTGDIRVDMIEEHVRGTIIRSVTDIASARAAGVALHVAHSRTCRALPARRR